MNGIIRLCFSMLAVVLLVVVGACAAPAPAPTQPPKPQVVKPDKLVYVEMGDYSGPYASLTAPYPPGLEDGVEYINTVLGGIDGVKLEGIISDSGNKMDVALSNYERIKNMSPRPLFVGNMVSTEAEALRERFAEDKMVAWVVSTNKSLYPAAYSFGQQPTYPDTFGAFMDWLKKNWKESRAPRVAILTWDSAMGRAVITDECNAYAKQLGIEIVATELFKMTDLDCSTQLLRIKDKNPDWIYTNSLLTGPVTILKSAQQVGYKIQLGGYYGIEQTTVMLGGAELMEGVVAAMFEPSWDDEQNSAIKLLNEWMAKKNRPAKFKAQLYQNAWRDTLVFREVVLRAVKEVGWDKLDGTAIKNQLVKMKDYSPQGLGVYSFTEKQRSVTSIFMTQVKGGKMLPITPFFQAPDLKPAEFK